MKFSQALQVVLMATAAAAAPAPADMSDLAKRRTELDEAIIIKIVVAYGDAKPSVGGEYPYLHPDNGANKIALGSGQRYDTKDVEELIKLVLDEAHQTYDKAWKI